MKRAIVLTLILAISISLASASFALYSKTLPDVVQTSFSTKIFDVFSAPHTKIDESACINDSPLWRFMAFYSNIITLPYNTNMIAEVTLPATADTSSLTVGLYTTNGTQVISPVTFDNITKKAMLVVPNAFLIGQAAQKIYDLKFFYKNNLISTVNQSSEYNTTFSVKVWAGNAQTVIDNFWFSTKFVTKNINFMNADLRVNGISPDTTMQQITVNPLTCSINYYMQNVTQPAYLTVKYGTDTCTYNFPMNQAYVPPNAVVLSFEEFTANYTITITNLIINGQTYSGPYTSGLSRLSVLLTGFTPITSNFQISFKYTTNGNPASASSIFQLYVGHT